jgi:hypothetical protein
MKHGGDNDDGVAELNMKYVSGLKSERVRE